MTVIIDGRQISKDVLSNVKEEISSLPFVPVFCDILVGENPVSLQYVNMKRKKAEEIGIRFHEASFPSTISTEDLINEIQKINKIPNMCGVIVQLPLPESLDQEKVLDAVDPLLDVDCLGTITSERFYNGNLNIVPPTALACIFILDSLNVNLQDKKIVIAGLGKLVGKPVAALLNSRNLNIEIVRSKTENKEKILKEADVIISGMGNSNYIKGDMIKKGAILIDAGSSESNSGIIGDVDLESVKGIASFVSPVPGGVGPITVAMLFKNVLKTAKHK